MVLFDTVKLQDYQTTDVILDLLERFTIPGDEVFTSQRWLRESLPKRLIYHFMYGDLLSGTRTHGRVLDVGGGFTSLTRVMLNHCDYRLLDIMAHCPQDALRSVEHCVGKAFWLNADWQEHQGDDPFDLVIANDLFPNVDQRLKMFLTRYLPLCRQLRISLTYYNSPRWYRVKRTDAAEVLHMMAWDGTQVERVLESYLDRIENPALHLLLSNPPSLFPNGRQVAMVVLRGERS